MILQILWENASVFLQVSQEFWRFCTKVFGVEHVSALCSDSQDSHHAGKKINYTELYPKD